MEQIAEGWVAEGRRGVVYRKTRNGAVYAEKRAKTPAVYGALAKEAILLEKLTNANVTCVPTYIGSGEWRLESEWREWEGFDKVREDTAEEWRHILTQNLIDAAYELDKQGVIHGELHRPMSNVRVQLMESNSTLSAKTTKGADGRYEYKITILDFERGTMGDDSGRNMRAIAQWMLTEKMLQVGDLKRLWTMTREEIYMFLSSLYTSTISMHRNTTHRNSAVSTSTWSTASRHTMLTSYTLLGGILVWVIVDLLTKYVLFDLRIGEELWRLTPIFNPGSGWSMPIPRRVSAALAVIAVMGILRLYRHKHIPLRAAMCIWAGALGNMYDRVVYHGVRDMFDLQVWPVFNVADIMLTAGVVVYIRRIFFSKQVSPHE